MSVCISQIKRQPSQEGRNLIYIKGNTHPPFKKEDEGTIYYSSVPQDYLLLLLLLFTLSIPSSSRLPPSTPTFSSKPSTKRKQQNNKPPTMPSKSVALITTSLRPSRIGANIAAFVKPTLEKAFASADPDIKLTPVDLRDFKLPIYNENVVPMSCVAPHPLPLLATSLCVYVYGMSLR